MSHRSDFNYHEGTTFSESASVSIHMYSFFPPNKHFTFFHYFLSLWEFFFCKTEQPGPYH